jgi:hypothetical protein
VIPVTTLASGFLAPSERLTMTTESPVTTETDSPPAWQRGMGVLTPFCGGILFIAGIEGVNDGDMPWGLVKIGTAAFMLITAWRWSR